MSTMFNLVPAHFEIGSEKSSKTGQSQGEFLTLLVYFTFVLVYSTFLQDGAAIHTNFLIPRRLLISSCRRC